jgi:hypothetical protein
MTDMSRRKLLPVLVIPVVTVVLGALMPARGNAEPAASAQWPGVPICAEGTLTAGERPADLPDRTPLLVSIEPCAGTDPAVTARARWGVAEYRGELAYIGELAGRPFAPDGPTTAELFGYRDSSVIGGTGLDNVYAACLITDRYTRVACLRITEVGAAGIIRVTPLPIDDPLVSRTLTVLDFGGNEADPVCGACV